MGRLLAMNTPVQIDWGSADVSAGKLSVCWDARPSSRWVERARAVVDRLGTGSAWGPIKITRKHVRVKHLQPGVEDELRYLLEGAVQQANADVVIARDADDAKTEHDRAMTSTFRRFADHAVSAPS
jgi:hypothetical protein